MGVQQNLLSLKAQWLPILLQPMVVRHRVWVLRLAHIAVVRS
jgi:hypothetical protein